MAGAVAVLRGVQAGLSNARLGDEWFDAMARSDGEEVRVLSSMSNLARAHAAFKQRFGG
jgi:hypothetical protein